MIRGGMVVLGIGLGILWIVGLTEHATAWMTWLDLIAAVISVGAVLFPESMLTAMRASPFVLALGLFALWIIGLAAGADRWMSWWNFAFGVVYLILGGAAGAERVRPTMTQTTSGPRTI